MVFQIEDDQPHEGVKGPPLSPYERVLTVEGDMIAFFTASKIDELDYRAMRKEMLEDPRFSSLSPKFFQRCRDTSSLWALAKSVNSSLEPYPPIHPRRV